MRGQLELVAAPAIELAPVEWTYCDGMDTFEIVGRNARIVLYVVDVASGAEPQNRIAAKLIMPMAGFRIALARLGFLRHPLTGALMH